MTIRCSVVFMLAVIVSSPLPGQQRDSLAAIIDSVFSSDPAFAALETVDSDIVGEAREYGRAVVNQGRQHEVYDAMVE